MKPHTDSSFATALVALRLPVILLVIALAGCAMPESLPEPARPGPLPVAIPETTWLQVDSDIGAASLAAAGPARQLARVRMERWRQLVDSRVESDFIPWFSGYWTQQWLSARVAWYKLSASEEQEAVVTRRLATYLQVEFRDRVLAPVAAEIDPEAVRLEATQYYVQALRAELQPIALHYHLPPEQFERRLKAIPVIELAPLAAHDASLHQLLHAGKPDSLPAYAALLEQGHQAAVEAGAGLSTTRISPVALRVSEQLLERLAISGGASAISALVGGIAGSVITLGAASVGIMLHENARGPTEALLRENLAAGVEDIWHSLMEDPISRVTAAIDHLTDQIEKCCPRTFGQPIELPGLPEEAPLADDPVPPPAEENTNDEEPSGFKTVD